jgi:hypothetical protein
VFPLKLPTQRISSLKFCSSINSMRFCNQSVWKKSFLVTTVVKNWRAGSGWSLGTFKQLQSLSEVKPSREWKERESVSEREREKESLCIRGK